MRKSKVVMKNKNYPNGPLRQGQSMRGSYGGRLRQKGGQ